LLHLPGAGSDFGSVIKATMKDSRVIVAVWSAAARASEWLRAETESARREGKLVVVCIDDTRLPAE
jgi:hypothetical protein